MLWREGWTDWKKAAAVFPSLGAVASRQRGAVRRKDLRRRLEFCRRRRLGRSHHRHQAVGRPSCGHRPSRTPKGKQSNTIVIISFFLILLCVLLVVVIGDGLSCGKTRQRRFVQQHLHPRRRRDSSGRHRQCDRPLSRLAAGARCRQPLRMQPVLSAPKPGIANLKGGES